MCNNLDIYVEELHGKINIYIMSNTNHMQTGTIFLMKNQKMPSFKINQKIVIIFNHSVII